jgi:hypothetical protein
MRAIAICFNYGQSQSGAAKFACGALYRLDKNVQTIEASVSFQYRYPNRETDIIASLFDDLQPIR